MLLILFEKLNNNLIPNLIMLNKIEKKKMKLRLLKITTYIHRHLFMMMMMITIIIISYFKKNTSLL
jgi:hypothetical protein